MTRTGVERESFWSAILFADLVGYSALMSRDEIGTLEFMVSCTRMIDEVSARYGGRLVQTTGDGYLIMFATVAGAVDFGVELHKLVAKRQTDAAHPAQFRVGIHCGEVHRSGGTIHGHAVNIAARLEGEAQPGTCVLSQSVHDALPGSAHVFEAIGAPPLKNIGESIALFRIPPADGARPVTRLDAAEITVVGTMGLRSNRAEIALSPRHKTSHLLGYLALVQGQRERDDKIAGLLWPEAGAAAARRSFRASRRRLAMMLAAEFPDLLVAADGHTGLEELRFDTDLALMLAELRRGRVPGLLIEAPDWPARVLEGFGRANPVLGAWLQVTRSTWRARILDALAGMLDRFDTATPESRDAARAVLVLEPGNEIASARLIGHHAARGNRSAALAEYDRIATYLADRHGLSPSEPVRAARSAAIGRSGPPRHADTATRSATRHRLLRIAVEPFDVADGDDPHRVLGFRGALISNLTRFREWSVIEAESRIAVAGATAAWDYAVGGVEKAPGRLGLMLRDLTDGRLIWTVDIALGSDNWVAAQRDAVGRIAAHLETYISADRLANVIGADEPHATSHDAWLQAERVFARWTPESADEAAAILRGVIADDPSFAPAYSSLASFCNVRHVIRPGSPRDAADAREAHGLAERAVELDPLDARNHLAVAWTAALTGAFERAAIHLDMAATLNPNGPATLVSCAMAHAFIGQADRGEALVGHVKRIAPMLGDYQWCYVAAVHFLSGNYEGALEAAAMSGDRIVDNQGWIAAALVRLGRTEEARTAFETLIDGVRPVWAGEAAPTAEAVFEWFVNAYPLRNPADRQRLSDALGAVLRGQ